MILPNKYIQESSSLIGMGGKVLSLLKNDMPLSELWELSKIKSVVNNYERFVLVLDMLFVMGLIDLENDKIIRTER